MLPITWGPRNLLKRTVFLLREHPILAIPVFTADLLGFAAMHIQHALREPLFSLFLSDGGSVLSASHHAFRLTAQNATEVALLTFPMVWFCYFLSILFYATALLTIFNLLKTICRGESSHFHRWYDSIAGKEQGLLLFSLLVWSLCVAGAVVIYLLVLAIMNFPALSHTMNFYLGLILAFLVGIPIVYFSTTPALKLLADPEASVHGAVVRVARGFGLVALAIQVAIAAFVRHAAPSTLFQPSGVIGFLFTETIESLLGALPYVFLFIALSVLLSEEPTTA
jgi:hypothetical protein